MEIKERDWPVLKRSLGSIQQVWVWALTPKLASGPLCLCTKINKVPAKLFCKLYCRCSPKWTSQLGKLLYWPQSVRPCVGNHCFMIWRNVFVTAANQKNEANIMKQNVYFMGLLYSEIMCFFFSVVKLPFLLWNMMVVDCRMFLLVLKHLCMKISKLTFFISPWHIFTVFSSL